MALRNTNYNKVITRNYTNDSNVELTAVPESGFDMSYPIRSGGHIIGRLYALSRQKTMPHDTVNGGLTGSIQFNDMATPIAPDMAIHAYQYYLSDRAVNADFSYLMSPSKLNNFSASASLPMFKPSQVIASFIDKYAPDSLNTYTKLNALLNAYSKQDASVATSALSTLGISTDANLNTFKNGFRPTGTNYTKLLNACKITYCDDATYRLMVDGANELDNFKTYSQVSASPLAFINAVFSAWYRVVGAYFGKTSYFDAFGYPCMNPRYLREMNGTSSISSYAQAAAFLLYGKSSGSELECNEHVLRKQFVFWLELMRNTQLEPNKVIFDYHKWNSNPLLGVFAGTTNDGIPIGLLAPRCVPFETDLLTSMFVDDICKHAYVPIVNPVINSDEVGAQLFMTDNSNPVRYNANTSLLNPPTDLSITDKVHSTLQSVKFNYFDNVANQDMTIETYLPSDISRFMSKLYTSNESSSDALRLDLGVLRQSKQLEKFQKIKFYFSDEYKDELSAIYMVDLKDAELFRPKLLSGDVNMIGVQQTVSSLGVDEAGQQANNVRSSIGNSNFPNLHYHDFIEEYGDIITVFYVSVKPQYDPLSRYNLWRTYQDFPNPIFAENNEQISYSYDISRTFGLDPKPFGHAPYHFDMRSRVGEIHGDFLDEKFYWQMPRTFNRNSTPVLNYSWLHMSDLKVGFMKNAVLTDGQYYLLAHDEMYVQRLLPSPVEVL